MKTFRDYVNEAYADDADLRHEELVEDSNMPTAQDSTSPISGTNKLPDFDIEQDSDKDELARLKLLIKR